MEMQEAVDILLIEDNPYDAELTMRALRRYNIGNSIVHLKNGEAALDFLFGQESREQKILHTPKVILLDLGLPRVDGFSVLKAIKSDPCGRCIPVVILTSSVEERDLIETYSLGANSYLVKPIGFESFCTSMNNFGFYWMLMNRVSRETQVERGALP